MNCRHCGARIPDRFLAQESFQYPGCGRKYFRKADSNSKSASRTSRIKPISKKRRPAVFLVLILIIIGVIVAGIITTRKPDDTAPNTYTPAAPIAAQTYVATSMPTVFATPVPTATTVAVTDQPVDEGANPARESTHDSSVFMDMYSEWFGKQETRYEFAGLVETGAVTEQELPSAYLHSYNVIYSDGWTLSYFVPVDGNGMELPFVYTKEDDYLTIVYPDEYLSDTDDSGEDIDTITAMKAYSEITADEYIACGKDLLLKYMRYPETVRWQQAGINSTDGYGRALVVLYCWAKNIYGGQSAECYWVCVEMNQDGTYSYNPEMPYCFGDTLDILAIRNLNNWGSPR